MFFFFSISSRYLTEKVVPGNRVTVMGIYSIKKVAQKADKVRCSNLQIRSEELYLIAALPVKRVLGHWHNKQLK